MLNDLFRAMIKTCDWYRGRVRELAAGTRDLTAEGGRRHYYYRHKTQTGTRRCFHPISGTCSRLQRDRPPGRHICFRQASSTGMSVTLLMIVGLTCVIEAWWGEGDERLE